MDRGATSEADRNNDSGAALLGPACPAPEETGPGAELQERMACRVGELNLLFPRNEGREVIPAPAATRIPNTAPWLRGLANVRGTLVPVVDPVAAFRMQREQRVPSYLLIFGQGEDALGMLIDGLPRLFRIDAAERVKVRPAVPPQLEGSLVAAYSWTSQIWLDVDPQRLFDVYARHIALSQHRSA